MCLLNLHCFRMFKKLLHKISVFIRWVSIWVTRITRFLTHDIFYLKEEDFSRWKGRLVKDAKTILLMLNTFTSEKIGFQVTALAYRSMMSVVPAIAIAFYLTSGVGLKDTFQEILVNRLGDSNITQILIEAADNIVDVAQSGLFGFISMASFLWIVIMLMITVRRVFNNVWKVSRETNFLGMIGVIVGITIMAPFVVILFFSGSVIYSHLLDLLVSSSFVFYDKVKSFMSWLMFAGASIMVIAAMYKFIPGTKVRTRYAFKAALIAGIAFTLVQYLYLETQMMVAKVSAVYGVMAALPLFMVWLNWGWTIILYGAELSYAFQNVDKTGISSQQLDKMNEEAVLKRRERLHNGMEL